VKTLSLFFVVVLCATFSLSEYSNAQPINKVYVGMNIGASSFTSGGGESKTDIHLGLESSYRLNSNYELIATGAATWDVNSTFWEVTGNGRYYFQPESDYKFFGEAGIGIYTLRVEFLGLVFASKSYAGINLGGGVSKGVLNDKLILNLKLKYHNPFTTDDVKANWINTTFGVSVPL